MKKSLIVLALMAAFGAHAQDTTVNSGSTSGSTSGASSGSLSGAAANNTGGSATGGTANSTAIGNQAGAQSGSQSSSGAASDSRSGALGNVVNLNQNVPTEQSIKSSSSSTSTTNGTIENRLSGGYNNTETQNIHYSGTTTVKNVPGIAMSGPASGPCTGASGGLGVAGPGFGVGLNGAKVDDGCTVRENTRILGQLFQSLDSNNPAKAQVQAALMKSMAILEAMNDKIAGDYIKPAPEPKKAEAAPAAPAPKVAEAAPAPAAPKAVEAKTTPVVAQATPIMMPATNLVAPPAKEPTDPYIRARMGLPKL